VSAAGTQYSRLNQSKLRFVRTFVRNRNLGQCLVDLQCGLREVSALKLDARNLSQPEGNQISGMCRPIKANRSFQTVDRSLMSTAQALRYSERAYAAGQMKRE